MVLYSLFFILVSVYVKMRVRLACGYWVKPNTIEWTFTASSLIYMSNKEHEQIPIGSDSGQYVQIGQHTLLLSDLGLTHISLLISYKVCIVII